MKDKFRRERYNYPVLERYTYLDNATTGLIPQYACDAMTSYLRQRATDGMDIDWYHDQWDFADDVRALIARMIGAESGQTICFGQNSSALFNIFCNGLGLKEGENVVVYDTVFPAMSYQWLNLQNAAGISVRIAKTKDGAVAPEDLFALVDDKTRAITVCHVDAGTGYRHDLKAIGHWCREHGIAFGVDATQSCGAMKIDVQAMEIDFLTSSSYKWLQGIQGIGFAYVSPSLMKKLGQPEIGWASVSDRINGGTWDMIMAENACRFECGGLPAVGLYGLKETISTYLKLGADDIQARILEVEAYLEEQVNKTDGLCMAYSHAPEHRSGLAFVNFPESCGLSEAVVKANGIRVRCSSPTKMRVGIHYFNSKEDIDRLIDFLKQRMAR